MEISLEKILDYSIKLQASDIYINEGREIVFRINGELKVIQGGIIDNSNINDILSDLFLDNNDLVNKFKENLDIDFSYLFSDKSSFRVNGFFSFGKINFVLRRIASESVPLEKLNLPEGINKFLTMKEGLILITGPTGSGKSTSMVSIVEYINKTRKEHILTIEDPIEFVFKNKESIISQRELGSDTKSMVNALKGFMREDPNIIIVGELRDKETVESAVELSGTGHLVISTLHTSSAAQTISRLISFFPPEQERTIRDKLADSIGGILCQRLIPKSDRSGRVGIYELMLPTTGIKNLIKIGEISSLRAEIEMGTSHGMITMQKYAQNLEERKIIKKEDYINYFQE